MARHASWVFSFLWTIRIRLFNHLPRSQPKHFYSTTTANFLRLAAREVDFDHEEFLSKMPEVNMTVMPEHKEECSIKKGRTCMDLLQQPARKLRSFFLYRDAWSVGLILKKKHPASAGCLSKVQIGELSAEVWFSPPHAATLPRARASARVGPGQWYRVATHRVAERSGPTRYWRSHPPLFRPLPCPDHRRRAGR